CSHHRGPRRPLGRQPPPSRGGLPRRHRRRPGHGCLRAHLGSVHDRAATAGESAMSEQVTTRGATHSAAVNHRKALTFRAEWARQLGRRRTLWIFGVLLALPVIFMAAFALDPDPDRGGTATGARFSDLATSSGANFAVFTLLVSGELLLYIVAALLV